MLPLAITTWGERVRTRTASSERCEDTGRRYGEAEHEGGRKVEVGQEMARIRRLLYCRRNKAFFVRIRGYLCCHGMLTMTLSDKTETCSPTRGWWAQQQGSRLKMTWPEGIRVWWVSQLRSHGNTTRRQGTWARQGRQQGSRPKARENLATVESWRRNGMDRKR